MKYEQIFSELKNGRYSPLYFFMGEEPYFIDRLTDYIAENVLTETEKTFNQMILYGKDTDIKNIINTARRFPMMAQHQVIIVKEAQHVKNIEELQHYIHQPLASTILVINYKYKKIDKRTRFFKLLDEKAVVFESMKIQDYKMPSWITAYLQQKKIKIEPKASSMLTDYLGNDIGKIVNELEKLLLVMPQGSGNITALQVEQNIGISKDYNTFELNNAMMAKDVLKANRIIDYFAKNPKNNPMVLTLSSLFYLFSKVLLLHSIKDKSQDNLTKALGIKPFFLREYQMAARNYSMNKVISIIGLLREYDLKTKGAGSMASESELLKELTFKIIH
ncbi:MAG: DNA polymerase III subunit delta [Bacteroidales bacterium]|nr:DNA polymerase III subunit delta [Bacteroidales bacterium]